MINEGLKFKGMLDIVLTSEDGNIKERLTVPNLVVSTGQRYIAARMTSNANAVISHMAIGNAVTAATIADSALGTEVARNALTSATVTTNVITYVATFGTNNPVHASANITEAGLFNAGASGELLCRTVFGQVTKANTDTLSITWTVTAGS